MITTNDTWAEWECCDSGSGRRWVSGSIIGECFSCGANQYCSGGTCVSACVCSGTNAVCKSNTELVRCTGCYYGELLDTCTCGCSGSSCNTCHECTTVGYTRCVSATVKETCTLVGGVRKWVPITCDCSCADSICQPCDQCQAGETRCVDLWWQNCNTVANPNVWQNWERCTYGCDPTRTAPACKAAPTIPYCINQWSCIVNDLAAKCGGKLTCGDLDTCVTCWDSFNDFLYKGEIDSYSCVNTGTCDNSTCHPTNAWCVGNYSPCPISYYPTRIEKWQDNCGGIDCRVPVSGSCGSSNPIPTPTPIPETPTCTINSLTASPTTFYPGIANTYTAAVTSTNFTPADAVDQVIFRVFNSSNVPISNEFIDNSKPYTFDYTPPTNETFKIYASGSIYSIDSQSCDKELTINVSRNTTTIYAKGYSTPIGTCVPTPISSFTANLTSTNPPLSLNQNNQTTFNDIPTGDDLTYQIVANKPVNYTYNAGICATPPANIGTFVNPVGSAETRNFTLPYASPSTQYTFNFFYTINSEPWFQIDSGDIASANDSISTEVPYNNSFLMPLTGESSGVAIAGQNVDVNSPLWPTNRSWTAEAVNFNEFSNGGFWYDYFNRTFDQQFTDQSTTTIDNQLDFTNLSWEAHLDEADSFVLSIVGDVTINGNLNINSGKKYTIFIDGSLDVNTANITVANGSFLAFVVTNDIDFTETTRIIQGVYLADGSLSVENNTTNSSWLSTEFQGYGIFAGRSGVSLNRNLNNPNPAVIADDLANNSTPAEKFTYRPDFLYNAPIGFKRIPLSWQEVEPGTIYQDVISDTPEEATLTNCNDLGGQCISSSFTCPTNSLLSPDINCSANLKCIKNSAVSSCTSPISTCDSLKGTCVPITQLCIPSDPLDPSTPCPSDEKCVPTDAKCGTLTQPCLGKPPICVDGYECIDGKYECNESSNVDM